MSLQQGSARTITTDGVVLATGYTERPAEALLGPLAADLDRDASGRPLVDAQHRLVFKNPIGGAVFVQNAERHTHGVGAPDLGLGAWRSAVILNTITGREAFPLPQRTAFTTFGLDRLLGQPSAAESETARATLP